MQQQRLAGLQGAPLRTGRRCVPVALRAWLEALGVVLTLTMIAIHGVGRRIVDFTRSMSTVLVPYGHLSSPRQQDAFRGASIPAGSGACTPSLVARHWRA